MPTQGKKPVINMSVEDIQTELDAIRKLGYDIETRMAEGLREVNDISGRLLSRENIEARITEMAGEFITLCGVRGVKNPVLITVREGASPFSGMFINALTAKGFRFQVDSVISTSYHGMSSGNVSIISSDKVDVTERDVFLIEDVIDKGNAYARLLEWYDSHSVKSIGMVALVNKPQPRPCKDADLVGFTIDKNAFIAGFGLDYNEWLRNVSWIGAVDLDTLPTTQEKAMLGANLEREKELTQQLRLLKATKKTLTGSAFYMDCAVKLGAVGVVAYSLLTDSPIASVGLLSTATSAITDMPKAVASLFSTGLRKMGLFQVQLVDANQNTTEHTSTATMTH